MKLLPPFPVDDVSLDMLAMAVIIQPSDNKTNLWSLLDMMSRMAGSDPQAVAEELDEEVLMMRDPIYTEHDVIEALVFEVRRLRQAAVN